MPYVRIKIELHDGTMRTGVRRFPDPLVLRHIRLHAFQLAAEVLGRGAIADVKVEEVPADDPAVVVLILRGEKNNVSVPRSDGTHPYVRQQQRKPPR